MTQHKDKKRILIVSESNIDNFNHGHSQNQEVTENGKTKAEGLLLLFLYTKMPISPYFRRTFLFLKEKLYAGLLCARGAFAQYRDLLLNQNILITQFLKQPRQI